jgi:RNA-binding protein YlmH
MVIKLDNDEILFKRRLEELANKSYNNSQYLFTGFLSMAELDIYYRMEHELSFVPITVWGGTNDCERVMLRFGNIDLCGYEQDFPISCIEISPLTPKFGEELSHRDYLGALMNLGIERGTLGDIVIIEKNAFLFSTDTMAPYIIDNLDKVRHTNVRCCIAQNIPDSTVTKFEHKALQVNAARTDSIIAKLYNISRSESVELFRAKKVFINGRLNENNSGQLKPNDKISVRGFGRFKYIGVSGQTRKGKLNVDIDIYA